MALAVVSTSYSHPSRIELLFLSLSAGSPSVSAGSPSVSTGSPSVSAGSPSVSAGSPSECR